MTVLGQLGRDAFDERPCIPLLADKRGATRVGRYIDVPGGAVVFEMQQNGVTFCARLRRPDVNRSGSGATHIGLRCERNDAGGGVSERDDKSGVDAFSLEYLGLRFRGPFTRWSEQLPIRDDDYLSIG